MDAHAVDDAVIAEKWMTNASFGESGGHGEVGEFWCDAVPGGGDVGCCGEVDCEALEVSLKLGVEILAGFEVA